MDFPVLLASDLHIVEKNLDQFRIFRDQIISLSPEFESIIFLGDIFDSPDAVKWVCILEFLELLENLSSNVFLLTGNHDRPLFGQNASTLDIFKRHAQVTISPVEIDDCLWLPYSEPAAAMEIISKSEVSVCFAHHMIKGVQLNSSTVTSQGLELSDFQRFEYVFNGHIHQPQIDSNLYILGSPWQHSFAEAGQQKYLWSWAKDNTILPIKSNVPSRYIIDTFENLKSQDLRQKFVKILMKPDDDPTIISKFLESAGASRWILQTPQAEELLKCQPQSQMDGISLDEMLVDFATTREFGRDETELGLHFLEER